MPTALPALAEQYLLQLENNEAFQQVIVLPYASYAEGALRRALAEAAKPAGPVKAEHAADPTKVRNERIMADCLREHMLYKEVATLVANQLAALRQGRATKEKTGANGQKDLLDQDEPA